MTNRQFPGNFGKFRRRTAEYVVLAVALIQGVLTAPAQSRVMNQPPSNEVIYARPEIAAALAEHYEALEGDVTRPDIEGGNPSNRGGNLLGKPANVRADSTPSGLVRIGAGQKFGSSRNSNGIVGGHSGRSPNDIRVERSFRNFDGIGGGHPFGNLDGSGAGESARNLDSIGGGGTEPRNLDRIGRGHLLRDPRHGLDTLTGISFGESKRSRGFNNRPGTFDEIDRSAFDDFGKRDSDGLGKRNIDEIDRTGFDSFVKRNLDEIDRAGWNGLLKRDLFEAYPRDRLH
ncbi:orcokinin peptides type A isoform X2 [Orussus abietinus]|uniref:orcokinin peptides type A isoform X2 n=1 Tax=Orussus abietinus TaxID=222816 RepID=UPI000626703D|nr:orcokinin peptides type A isoform X2 [Orussus abietinus]